MTKIYKVEVSPQKPINITKIGETRWRGSINNLKWNVPESLAAEICVVIKNRFPNVTVDMDVEFAADDNQLVSSLVVQVESSEEINLEPVIASFLSLVTNPSSSQDLLIDPDGSLRSEVSKNHTGWLQRHAGKNVGIPLQIRSDQFQFVVAGKFAPIPRDLHQEYDSFIVRGRVNGFLKRERTLSLCSETEGTLVSTFFDLNQFMHQIAKAALYDTVHNFTIHPRENEKGELRNTLIAMSAAIDSKTLC
jgi:hypothetical protein